MFYCYLIHQYTDLSIEQISSSPIKFHFTHVCVIDHKSPLHYFILTGSNTIIIHKLYSLSKWFTIKVINNIIIFWKTIWDSHLVRSINKKPEIILVNLRSDVNVIALRACWNMGINRAKSMLAAGQQLNLHVQLIIVFMHLHSKLTRSCFIFDINTIVKTLNSFFICYAFKFWFAFIFITIDN